jgi:hypothetical protein
LVAIFGELLEVVMVMWWKSLGECLKSWIVNKKLQLLKIIMNWIVVD